MYSMTGSQSASTTLLSQLMEDPSGELLQSLQNNLNEAIARTAAFGASPTIETDEREVIDSLQLVFAAARDILDKAAFAVGKGCYGR